MTMGWHTVMEFTPSLVGCVIAAETWRKPRTQLSKVVGCAAGMVGFHRPNQTKGVFVGVDRNGRFPIFINLFERNQAAHMIIAGQSGYGKTVLLITGKHSFPDSPRWPILIQALEANLKVSKFGIRVGERQRAQVLDEPGQQPGLRQQVLDLPRGQRHEAVLKGF